MPYGFPNVDINFQISEAKDNAGNSGTSWCKSRQEAKGNQLANNILWKWGFSKTDETLYYYKCANITNGFGLWNNATNYKGKGSAVSAADARATPSRRANVVIEVVSVPASGSVTPKATCISPLATRGK